MQRSALRALRAVVEIRLAGEQRVPLSSCGALGQPGEEVARWDRSGLQVTWRDGGHLYHAMIAPASGPGMVQCSVGKTPLSESFLDLLSDPTRRHPAS